MLIASLYIDWSNTTVSCNYSNLTLLRPRFLQPSVILNLYYSINCKAFSENYKQGIFFHCFGTLFFSTAKKALFRLAVIAYWGKYTWSLGMLFIDRLLVKCFIIIKGFFKLYQIIIQANIKDSITHVWYIDDEFYVTWKTFAREIVCMR